MRFSHPFRSVSAHICRKRFTLCWSLLKEHSTNVQTVSSLFKNITHGALHVYGRDVAARGRLCWDLVKHKVVLCSEWSVDPHDSLFVGDSHSLFAIRLRCTLDDDDDDDVLGELWRYGTVPHYTFIFRLVKFQSLFLRCSLNNDIKTVFQTKPMRVGVKLFSGHD